MIILRIPIDNGSTLNVCLLWPWAEPTSMTMIHLNGMMVGAFDCTETSANWKKDLKILVGPCEFKVSSVAVDIPTVFNLLLGRPWIHSVGAILSSLHHNVKFISRNKLVHVWLKSISQYQLQVWCLSLTRSKWMHPSSITLVNFFLSIIYRKGRLTLSLNFQKSSWWSVGALWNANISREQDWTYMKMWFWSYQGKISEYNLQPRL